MSTKARKSPTIHAPSRERILAAASDLFARDGFDAMTMRQLGDAVGLDNSTLYRHFPSKAAIIDAVLDRTADSLLEVLTPALDAATPPTLAGLEDIAATAGLYLFDNAASARLLVHWLMAAGETPSGVRIAIPATDTGRPGGRLLMRIHDWLTEGARRKTLRAVPTPDALVILLGILILRPATRGHLLQSLEPGGRGHDARATWERELRAAVRGAFTP